MSMTTQYGVLLVSGAHTHQENYAPAFRRDARCRLVGLTDEPTVPLRRDALNRKLAAELEIPVLDDIDAALGRSDVDLVCVCAEPERRARIAVRCAEAGKHVYMDKPPATSGEDAGRLVSAVRENGVRSQVFSLVRSAVGQRAQAVLESGRLGELTGLHCELLFAKGPAGTADLSQPRRERAEATRFTFLDSKRELFAIGVYPLILFQWLTGKRIESVYGSTSNYFFRAHQRNDAEDFACLMLRLEGGIEATITAGRTGWHSHPGFGVHQVHLAGTAGRETVDANRPRLEVYSDAPPWRAPDVLHPEDPMGFWSSTQRENGVRPKDSWWPVAEAAQSDAAYFLDCLVQERESNVPVAVGAHAVEVIRAGYESAATGEVVTLASPAD